MNRIKELRIKNKEGQETLCKLLNVSKATISKYENGSVGMSDDTMIKIADHYGVTIDYLLGRTDIPNSEEKLTIAASMKNGLDISDMTDDEKKFINDFVKMVRKKKN